MQNEDAIRAEALQDTKELFNILMYIHQMHESVVGLLSDLKSPDPDVAGTLESALSEMAAVSDAMTALRSRLEARLGELGIMSGDVRH